MYVGIDVGGTQGRCSLYPSLTSTEEVGSRVFPVTQLSEEPSQEELDLAYQADYNSLWSACYELRQEFGSFLGIGLALAGVTDKARTCIMSAGIIHHFENRPVVSDLSLGFGCKVALGNDAEAAAMAEAVFGQGQGSDFWFIIWGTGVGGTLIRVVNGKPVPFAGELGHTCVDPTLELLCKCGQFGCLEVYAGGGNLPRWFNGSSGPELTDNEMREVLPWMKIGVRNVVCSQPVPLVVFGGGLICKREFLLSELESQLKEELTMAAAPRIALSAFGESAGTIGAMTLLNMQ